MSKIFTNMVGAAILVAASSATAVAQDYTWTLENFRFGDYFDAQNGSYQGTEASSATASGNFVLTKVGAGYELKSYNFTTLPSASFGGTGFAATYNSAVNSFYGTDELPADKFDTYLQMPGLPTDPDDLESEFTFRLTWANGALFDSMSFNGGAGELNALVDLDGSETSETDDQNFRRYNQQVFAAGPQSAVNAPEFPGGVRLTAVAQVTTPEPASLALLGTGLLGIFAARRRKAA